jgi:hypothetical protein
MRELKGDLWKLAEQLKPDAVCITTNGSIKKNGQAVLGRGCGKEAALADPILVKQSALQLVALIQQHGWTNVLMPRPGCGAGGLRWPEVKAMLEGIFDDRVCIVSRPTDKAD